jgi:hypothetical protein
MFIFRYLQMAGLVSVWRNDPAMWRPRKITSNICREYYKALFMAMMPFRKDHDVQINICQDGYPFDSGNPNI